MICLERRFALHFLRDDSQRRADERVRHAEFFRDMVNAVAELDVSRPRDQQSERHRLRVSIGKLGVIRFRKQHPSPACRQREERLVAH